MWEEKAIYQNISATVALASRAKGREKHHLAEPCWCYVSDQFSIAVHTQMREQK